MFAGYGSCERFTIMIMRQFKLVGWPQVGPSALTAGVPAAVVGRMPSSSDVLRTLGGLFLHPKCEVPCPTMAISYN